MNPVMTPEEDMLAGLCLEFGREADYLYRRQARRAGLKEMVLSMAQLELIRRRRVSSMGKMDRYPGMKEYYFSQARQCLFKEAEVIASLLVKSDADEARLGKLVPVPMTSVAMLSEARANDLESLATIIQFARARRQDNAEGPTDPSYPSLAA